MTQYRCMNCGKYKKTGKVLITCPYCEKQYLVELDLSDIMLKEKAALRGCWNTAYAERLQTKSRILEAFDD